MVIVIIVEHKMLTKTLRIEDSILSMPELGKFKGKIVEIVVKEKKETKKKKLNKFFSLCGKVSLDSTEVEKLRDESYI